MVKSYLLFSFILILFILAIPTSAQNRSKEYNDGHGGKLTLPMGDISFADEVVEFKRGKPHAVESACDSTLALGPPDYKGFAGDFVSLGCGGALTLLFTDNALVNIPGPDLFVFETGKYVEATQLEISKDGIKWLMVGKISGGTTTVDLGDSIKEGEVFHYVRLTDLKSDCKGDWPGADIDAVAAIGSGEQITLNNTVLFQVNDYTLAPNAKRELNKAIEQIKLLRPSQIVIEGNSDNTGNESYNKTLSKRRAQAVADYFKLSVKGLVMTTPIKIEGYGSSLPIASNATKLGQEKNRRVNIILVP